MSSVPVAENVSSPDGPIVVGAVGARFVSDENTCRTLSSVAMRSCPFENTGEARPGLESAEVQRSKPVRASSTATRPSMEDETTT